MKHALVTSFFAALLATGPLTGVVRAEGNKDFHTETTGARNANGDVNTKIHTESRDANGTVTKHDVEEKTETTGSGGRRAKLTHKTTQDPKGLMNKTTEKSEASATYNTAGGLEKKSSYEGVDSSGTAHTVTSETATSKKAGGGHRTVMKDKEVRDPKGLMNKKTVEKTTTVDRDASGKATVTSEKEVDGETVERKVTEGAE